MIGEANFSDHGANRLGASALMQGLADGYFILPYTIGDYLAQAKLDAGRREPRRVARRPRREVRRAPAAAARRATADAAWTASTASWAASCGTDCGMSRSGAGLRAGDRSDPRRCASEFWQDVCVGGTGEDLNQALEQAGRVADFLEFAELMCEDALHREESCGGHFREEYPDARRRGAARRRPLLPTSRRGSSQGVGKPPVLHKEPLTFEDVHLAQRSYK